MSPLLEKAIEEIRKMPEEQQEVFTGFILAELEVERRWDELFEQSQDLLSELADEALKEHWAGKDKSA
jgi:hypothetical protein